MKINKIIWLEDIVDKLIWKHNVEEYEVIEVLENRPIFKRKEAGHKSGEDVYSAFGQTNAGRFLSVFFVYTQDKRAIVVSARDMSDKERKKYVK
ncbi:BrnT family toxin [Candidatus Halobeggiatoa sp. HSG11]|nr:BrnT family toxin [Candidatus Halobeggiatoa sp. HSG11]